MNEVRGQKTYKTGHHLVTVTKRGKNEWMKTTPISANQTSRFNFQQYIPNPRNIPPLTDLLGSPFNLPF
jgi:hypothetical protein